ncbi:hypothetical protein [Selenomonas sp. AE3005]|uniref:hypothetical protein n=1 Tax=Selenomonas sp. AE3005 TaxID=1485543 RepID=UPI0004877CA7|nr:hypothetical protein [Selenomonas sp. AE3005]
MNYKQCPDIALLYKEFYEQYQMDYRHNMMLVDAATGQGKTYSFLWFAEALLEGKIEPKVNHRKDGDIIKEFKLFYIYPKKLDAPIQDINNGSFPKLKENYVILHSRLDALKECWGDNFSELKEEGMVQKVEQMITPFIEYCERFGGKLAPYLENFLKSYRDCAKMYYHYILMTGKNDNTNIECSTYYSQIFLLKKDDAFEIANYRVMVTNLKIILKKIAEINEWEDYENIYKEERIFGIFRKLFPAMELFNPKRKVFFMTAAKALRIIDPIIAPSFYFNSIRKQFSSKPVIHLFIDELDEFIIEYNKIRYDEARNNRYGIIGLAQQLLKLRYKRLSKLGKGFHGELEGENKVLHNKITKYCEQIDSKIDNILEKYPFLPNDFKFENDEPEFIYLAIFGYPLLRCSLSNHESEKNIFEYIMPYKDGDSDEWSPHNKICSTVGKKEKQDDNNYLKLRDFIHDITMFNRSVIAKISFIVRIYHELINKKIIRSKSNKENNYNEDLSIFREINLKQCVTTVLDEFGLYDSNTSIYANPYVSLVLQELSRDTFGYRRNNKFLFIPAVYSFFNRGYHIVWPKQDYSHYQKDDISSCDCVSSCENFFLHLTSPNNKNLSADNKLRNDNDSHVLIYGLSATSHYDSILTNLNYNYISDIGDKILYYPSDNLCRVISRNFDSKNRFNTKKQEVNVSCIVPDEKLIEISTQDIKDEICKRLHYYRKKDLCDALADIGVEDSVGYAEDFYEELEILIQKIKADGKMEYRMRYICIFLECFRSFLDNDIRSFLFFNTASLCEYEHFLKRAALVIAVLNNYIHTKYEFYECDKWLYFFKATHFRDEKTEYDVNEKNLRPVLFRLAKGERAFIITSYASAGRSFNPIYPAPFQDLYDERIHCIGDDDDVTEFERKRLKIIKAGKQHYEEQVNRWFNHQISSDPFIMVDFQGCYTGMPTYVFPFIMPQDKMNIISKLPEAFIQGLDYLCRLRDYNEISIDEFKTGLNNYALKIIQDENTKTFNNFSPKKLISTQISALQIVVQAIGRITRGKNRYSEIMICVQNELLKYPWQIIYGASKLNHNHYIKIIMEEANKRGVSPDYSYEQHIEQLNKQHLITASNNFGKLLSEIAQHFGEEGQSKADELARLKFDDLHTYCLQNYVKCRDSSDFLYPSIEGAKERNIFIRSLTGKPICKRYYKFENNRQTGRYVRISEVSDTPPGDGWSEMSADALQLPLYDQCIEFHEAFKKLHIPIEWEPQLYLPVPSFFEQVCKGRIGEIIQDVFLSKYLGYTPKALSENIYELFDRAIKEASGIYFDAKFMTENSFHDYVESSYSLGHLSKKIKTVIDSGKDIQGVVIINTRILSNRVNTPILTPKKYFIELEDRKLHILQIPQLLKPIVGKYLVDNICDEAKEAIKNFIADMIGGENNGKN